MASSAMAEGAVPTSCFSRCATGQAPVAVAVAEGAVVLVDGTDHIQGTGRVMADGTGRGRGDISLCLVVNLDVSGVCRQTIGNVAFTAVNAIAQFPPVDFLLVGRVVGVVAGVAGDGAVIGDVAHVEGGAITAMAVGTRQERAGVENNHVMLGSVRVKWVDD